MEQNEHKKTMLLWGGIVLALVVGYIAGAAVTKKTLGEKISELQAVVNAVYPPPAGEIKAINGSITSIQNDTIELDIPSLTQSYPKPGESLPRQTITVAITPETKITELLLDPKAKPKIITKAGLVVGDSIYITVAEDLMKTPRTNALTIQKNVYPTSGIK